MSQPVWEMIDSCDDHALFVDKTGEYAPELAVFQIGEGEEHGSLYRFPLEFQKWVQTEPDGGIRTSYLVGGHYKPTHPHPVHVYQEWFIKDLARVAESYGLELEELEQDLTDKDPRVLARAYLCIGGYHGFINLDHEPRQLTEEEWLNYE